MKGGGLEGDKIDSQELLRLSVGDVTSSELSCYLYLEVWRCQRQREGVEENNNYSNDLLKC